MQRISPLFERKIIVNKFKSCVAVVISIVFIVCCIIPGTAALFEQKIIVNRAEITLSCGETFLLHADTLDGSEVTWSSSDPAVAQVSQTGNVTGCSVGTATIYASVGKCVAQTSVTVTNYPDKAWGIDVSEHNGQIDWHKVKQSGVNFAIIRLGYGVWWGGHITIDQCFYQNIEGARNAGVDIGLYIYSYAKTVEAAQVEADQVLEILREYPQWFTYPIWYDVEDSGQASAERKDLNTQQVLTFCSALQNAGYYTGVYSYLSFFETYLNDSQLSGFDHWIAQYGPDDGEAHRCDYNAPHGMWQYTSCGESKVLQGTTDGEGLDLNYSYKNYPGIMFNQNLNGFWTGCAEGIYTADMTWNVGDLCTFSENVSPDTEVVQVLECMPGEDKPYLIGTIDGHTLGWFCENDLAVWKSEWATGDRTKFCPGNLYLDQNGSEVNIPSASQMVEIADVQPGAHPYLLREIKSGTVLGWTTAAYLDKYTLSEVVYIARIVLNDSVQSVNDLNLYDIVSDGQLKLSDVIGLARLILEQ